MRQDFFSQGPYKTVNMDDTKAITRGVKPSNYHTTFTKRLWIFMALGVIIIVFGLITVGVFYNIKTITSSTDKTEIFPSYIASAVVSVTGFLVLILFWRRPLILVAASIVLCISCGCFCVVVAILTVTQILQPITSLDSCVYLSKSSSCTCKSVYKDEATLTFIQTSSCESVESNLPILLYIQCGIYLIVFALCVASALCAFLVWRLEKSRLRELKEQSYEEIFTVSGSSSSISDCDEDVTLETVSRNNSSSAQNDPLNLISRNINNGRNTCPPGILKNSDKQQLQMTNGLSRSKSCDSIDLIYASSKVKSDSTSESPKKGKGKLKEHRRRDRRAVTLHNLDTKQLMLILDLQMRYLEESRQLKSQGNLTQSEKALKPPTDSRRAITPQPYVSRKTQPNTLPKSLRSHTPQPGKSYEFKNMSEPRMKKKGRENWLFQTNENLHTKNTENISHNSSSSDQFMFQNENRSHGNSPSNVSVATRKSSTDSEQVNVTHRPKSRPSVQQHFLPPEPIHRSKSVPVTHVVSRKSAQKSVLPPQPISRQIHHRDFLPVEAVHRNGSAFQIVGHPNKSYGPMYGREAFSHDAMHRTPGEIFCEKAIRDNFKLYASPFLLQDSSLRGHGLMLPTFRQPVSETPPAYTHPPPYNNSVSQSQDESSCGSPEENLYETYDFTDQRSKSLISDDNQTDTGSQSKYLNGRKESQTSSLPESEDDVFLPDCFRGISGIPKPHKMETKGDISGINKTKIPDIISHQCPPEPGINPAPFIPVYMDMERRRKPKKRKDQIKDKISKAVTETLNKSESKEPRQLQNDPKSNDGGVQDIPSATESYSQRESPVYAISAKMKRDRYQNPVPDEFFNSSSNPVFAQSVAKDIDFVGESSTGMNSNSSTVDNFGQFPPGRQESATKEDNPRFQNTSVVAGYDMNYQDVGAMPYVYPGDSAAGPAPTSQASLLTQKCDYNQAIDELHPGLGDPHVLETMI